VLRIPNNLSPWQQSVFFRVNFLSFAVAALPPRKKCSMGESGINKVCPYCEGKGYVSVAVELPPTDNPREEMSGTTWVRKPCPLCDGKGRISGDDSTPGPKLAFQLIYRLEQRAATILIIGSCHIKAFGL
jgi:hypothetical protein